MHTKHLLTDMESTTNHSVIQQWAMDRGGTPAVVSDTYDGNNGVLTIDFGDSDEELEELSWNEFFKIFDEGNMAMMYHEERGEEKQHRIYEFLDKDFIPKHDEDGDDDFDL